MTDLHALLKKSVDQHQRLHTRLTAIEKRLPILDLDATVQASEDMDILFSALQKTDQEIMAVLDAELVTEHGDLIEQRLQLGETLMVQYQTILPRLKTRLAGYRAELLKIRHGLRTMNGYSSGQDRTGGIINTSN
jgi:hypothetical protein